MSGCKMRLLAVLLRMIPACAFLSSCGGGGDSSLAPAPGPPPPAATTQQVFSQLPAFTQPVALERAPGDSTRWFIVERRGVIHAFANDPAVSASSIFLDIAGRVDDSFSESGLLGMAFHPNFPATPSVYVSYTTTGSGAGNPLTSRIARFTTVDGGQTLLAASEQTVLEILQPFSNHNGGDLAFGQDGFLYASFGDGGSAGDPQDNAQDTNNLLGTIARIDVDTALPYGIPNDNPNFGNGLCFQGFGAAACPETYAWGLRNPWRFSFDSATGDLWAGDVGQSTWEEIDRIENGQNYGWDDREGAHCFEPPSACITSSVDPISEYGRDFGSSVTGGFVYRGAAIEDLVGCYVFADFVSGRVFAVLANSQPTIAPTELDDTELQISTLAQDSNGEIYLVHYSGGTIHQLVDVP